ncbi:MAG: gliding motility protein RemB, partial [Bacteroidia bacterium]
NVKGLSLQGEYNEVRPYTYSHGVIEQNYSHYGMALAHPFGSNFKEFLGFLSYRKNNFEFNWQGIYAIIGKDSLNGKSNIGQNIFLSYTTRAMEYGNKTTQGIKTNLLQSNLKLTYYIIPDMNMRLELGYIQRSETNKLGYLLQSPFIYLGFKTSFWNRYRDL